MSGIHLETWLDHLLNERKEAQALIRKIAVCRTSEDIDEIDDEDIREEVREDDLQGVRDTLDRIIYEARQIMINSEQEKESTQWHAPL